MNHDLYICSRHIAPKYFNEPGKAILGLIWIWCQCGEKAGDRINHQVIITTVWPRSKGLALKCLNLRNNYTEKRRIMEWLLSTCFFSRASFFYGVTPVSKNVLIQSLSDNNTCGPLWMKYNFRGISAWIRMDSPNDIGDESIAVTKNVLKNHLRF